MSEKTSFADVVGRIDWDMLFNQKQCLIELIWYKPNDPLWGIVNFIDSLQDVACDLGVWKFPENDSAPVFPKWKLRGPESVKKGALMWDLNTKSAFMFDGDTWKPISLEEYRSLLADVCIHSD